MPKLRHKDVHQLENCYRFVTPSIHGISDKTEVNMYVLTLKNVYVLLSDGEKKRQNNTKANCLVGCAPYC